MVYKGNESENKIKEFEDDQSAFKKNLDTMEIPNILAGKSIYRPNPSPYNCLKLQGEMIRDRSILNCRNAILQNPHLFQNKVVLEVHCGTAILSMFIASQGAKTVIGIEPSIGMATIAQNNVEKNNITNVRILKRDVDQLDELPEAIEKVDIIVSQWQAYLIFDRKLLESLLKARDRWLKPDGIMFPDLITLHIAGVQCESTLKHFHQNLKFKEYSYSSLSDIFSRFPQIENVHWQQIVTNSATVRKMNLKKMSIEDFSFSENFILTCLQHSFVHAFVLYFEVNFAKGHKALRISSSPFEPKTRWKQILLYFKDKLDIYPNEQIKGTFKMKENGKRALNFGLAVDFMGAFGTKQFFEDYVFQ